MDQGKKVIFRNALNGYHKSDVNEYITGIAKEFSRRSEDWEQEKIRLFRALDEEKTETENAKKLSDELACQYYSALTDAQQQKKILVDEQSKNEKLLASEKELKLETELLKAELEEKNAIIETSKKDIENEQKKAAAAEMRMREMADTIRKLEASLSEKEAALEQKETSLRAYMKKTEEDNAVFAKLNEKVEQIMTTANNSAHEIVERAIARGNEIVEEAEKKAEQIHTSAVVRSEMNYYDDVMNAATEICDNMSKLMTEIGEKRAKADGKLDSLHDGHATVQELVADKPSVSVQDPIISIDEKIERFFKTTMDSINDIKENKS